MQNYLISLKKTEVFKKYYRPWGTYRRQGLTGALGTTYDALKFFYGVIDNVQTLMTNTTDEYRVDGAGVIQLIKDVVQFCLSDDSVITMEEFKFFVDYVIGMYEGYANKVAKAGIAGEEQASERREVVMQGFTESCKDKAFWKNLNRIDESMEIESETEKWAYLKNLSSFITHIIIEGEQKGSYAYSAVQESVKLLQRELLNMELGILKVKNVHSLVEEVVQGITDVTLREIVCDDEVDVGVLQERTRALGYDGETVVPWETVVAGFGEVWQILLDLGVSASIQEYWRKMVEEFQMVVSKSMNSKSYVFFRVVFPQCTLWVMYGMDVVVEDAYKFTVEVKGVI